MTTIYRVRRFEIPEAKRTGGMKPLVDTLNKMLFSDYYTGPDQEDIPETDDQERKNERGETLTSEPPLTGGQVNYGGEFTWGR